MEIPGGVLLKAKVSAVRRKGEFEKAGKACGESGGSLGTGPFGGVRRPGPVLS